MAGNDADGTRQGWINVLSGAAAAFAFGSAYYAACTTARPSVDAADATEIVPSEPDDARAVLHAHLRGALQRAGVECARAVSRHLDGLGTPRRAVEPSTAVFLPTRPCTLAYRRTDDSAVAHALQWHLILQYTSSASDRELILTGKRLIRTSRAMWFLFVGDSVSDPVSQLWTPIPRLDAMSENVPMLSAIRDLLRRRMDAGQHLLDVAEIDRPDDEAYVRRCICACENVAKRLSETEYALQRAQQDSIQRFRR